MVTYAVCFYLGFIRVTWWQASDFKMGLKKIGLGGLSSTERSLLVRRFDPGEEGMVRAPHTFCQLAGRYLSIGVVEGSKVSQRDEH